MLSVKQYRNLDVCMPGGRSGSAALGFYVSPEDFGAEVRMARMEKTRMRAVRKQIRGLSD